jgi:AGZA family xanthine/uracil permease-like MFS transporter
MKRYGWAQWGDINAFFGLMLDNVAVMLLLVGAVCSAGLPYSFTPEFVLTRLIPGTALGVLLGDLWYTWMAFRLARRTNKPDVTAMPLGLDTPSTFGMAYLILLPALKQGREDLGMDHETAMNYAWHVAVVTLLFIGGFKVLFAPIGNLVRDLVPRAGLLGSLAAIALALISFLPLLNDVAAIPLVGFLSLMVILVTLLGHRPLPGRIPGALAAVLLGLGVYWLCHELTRTYGWPLLPTPERGKDLPPWQPPTFLSFSAWDAGWWERVGWAALARLPVALPFALATIVGGIDCTESAAAAGDEYDTRAVLLTEGVTSVAAAFLGGVIQTTPYIGQPAYKAMGGRAAYTLATALFIGAAGYFGWFTHFFEWLPKAAMFPILIYVGLEITGQSFRVTPTRHYPALALAVLPALAYLATIPMDQALGGRPVAAGFAATVQTLRCLANGFIVTSLLWAAALATMLDGKLVRSALYLLVAGVFALFGIIHSPLRENIIALPWTVIEQLPPEGRFHTPYHWSGAYALCAGLLLLLALVPAPRSDQAAHTASPRAE